MSPWAGTPFSQPEYSGPSRHKRQLGRNMQSLAGTAALSRLGRGSFPGLAVSSPPGLRPSVPRPPSKASTGLVSSDPAGPLHLAPGWACPPRLGLLRLRPRLGRHRRPRLGLPQRPRLGPLLQRTGLPRLGFSQCSTRLGQIRRIRPGRDFPSRLPLLIPVGPGCDIPAGPGWCSLGPGRIIFIAGRIITLLGQNSSPPAYLLLQHRLQLLVPVLGRL
jgi:hypothetical protein